MRFLHTADWHVGKPLRGRSRMDEHAAALEQVARIAIEERVDAVLIAGDVFDSASPPPEAEKIVFDFLARLLPERVACVVLAGNHDHPRRLGALTSLLEGLRIHVRAEVRPPSEGGVVSLSSRDGREEARIAVLPFVPERKVVDAALVMGPEDGWYKTYASRVARMLDHLTRGLGPDTVNVLLAHLLIDGARVGTGERALHLGQIYGLTAEELPSNVQYIGLGHLHRPQEVLAPVRTFYSGSLLELDFGELEQDKRVVIVDAKPRRAPAIESVPVTAGRRLRDVKGTLVELEKLAPTLGSDYLRVAVVTEGPVPGLAEQVRELLPDAVEVTLDYPRVASGTNGQPSSGALPPGELFARFYLRKNGSPPAPELSQLFHDLYDEAHG
jgi:DNA repair protein SbcD/Mre11